MRRLWSVAGVLAVMGVAATAWLILDAQQAEVSLQDARARLNDARSAAADGDLDRVAGDLQQARDRAEAATRHVDGPHWWLTAHVPFLGRTPRVVRAIVDVASVATELADDAWQDLRPILEAEGSSGTDIDLRRLTAVEEVIAALDLDGLVAARDRLQRLDPAGTVGRVADARSDTLELAGDAERLLRRAGLASRTLPRFLGADGARTYLLAMQNNAELRGTGGLIGLFAELHVDAGRIRLGELSRYEEFDERFETDLSPVDVSEAFEDRYGHVNAAGNLKNVNVDPDLPTTAPVLLDLYADRTGRRLDGVVAIDPVGMSTVLEAVGPVDVPGEIADPRIPDPIPPAALPRVTMFDAYEVFGGPEPERKRFLREVSRVAFERVMTALDDPLSIVGELGEAVAERHVQVHSRDEDEQEAFAVLGVTGGMSARDDGDLLAVTANNAAANKQDVHVGHAVDARIALREVDAVLHRDAHVAVAVRNPLPTTGMDEWIVGSAEPGLGTRGRNGPAGLNRTWFTVWLPDASEVLAGRTGDGGPIDVTTGSIHGHLAVDHFLETPSRSTRSFELDLTGPLDASTTDGRFTYTLTVWRQAKAVPDDLDLSVELPTGWRVAEVSVEGGGDGWRPTMSADPRPDDSERMRVEQTADAVRLVGQVTQDVHLVLSAERG